MQATQQLVQGAQHLLGQGGGHLGLRPAAGVQQCGQAAVRGVLEQARPVQQQLERPQHRAPGHGGQRAQGHPEPAAALATLRGMDQAQRVVGQQQPGGDSSVAQQPLEALVRRGLPAEQRAAPVSANAGGLYADQHLPALALRRGHRHVRLQHGVGGWQGDAQDVGQLGAARAAGHLRRSPAQNA